VVKKFLKWMVSEGTNCYNREECLIMQAYRIWYQIQKNNLTRKEVKW